MTKLYDLFIYFFVFVLDAVWVNKDTNQCSCLLSLDTRREYKSDDRQHNCLWCALHFCSDYRIKCCHFTLIQFTLWIGTASDWIVICCCYFVFCTTQRRSTMTISINKIIVSFAPQRINALTVNDRNQFDDYFACFSLSSFVFFAGECQFRRNDGEKKTDWKREQMKCHVLERLTAVATREAKKTTKKMTSVVNIVQWTCRWRGRAYIFHAFNRNCRT